MQSPIYPKTIYNQVTNIKNGMLINSSGEANVTTVWNGKNKDSVVYNVIIKPLGVNVACVLKFYINNGLDYTNPLNNAHIYEVAVPAYNTSTTAAAAELNLQFNLKLPKNYILRAGLSTGLASGLQLLTTGAVY